MTASDYDDLSDEEFGRLVREALRGKELQGREHARTQSGFSKFLHDIGLATLASAVYNLALGAWHILRHVIFGGAF